MDNIIHIIAAKFKKSIPCNVFVLSQRIWHIAIRIFNWFTCRFIPKLYYGRNTFWVNSVLLKDCSDEARNRVQNIISTRNKDKKIIVFIPGMDWNDPMFQRPQQLARAFAKNGHLVYYGSIKEYDTFEEIGLIEENLYLFESAKAFEGISNLVLFVYWASMKRIVEIFDEDCSIIYDCIDHLSVWDYDIAPGIAEHKWLLKKAKIVLVTSDDILKEIQPLRSDAFICPNACDYNHFHLKSKPDIPADLTPLASKKIVGYFGALAPWFDFDLLKYAANELYDVSFILIGKVIDNALNKANLNEYPNIYFLGAKKYTELPNYTAYFDAALIPFKVNNITLSTSPVKLFEYMAAGIQVVSTALPECKKYSAVKTVENKQDFVDAIQNAINGNFDSALIDKEAQENSWISRAECIIFELEKCI